MRKLQQMMPLIALLLLGAVQVAQAQVIGKVISVVGSVQATRVASGEIEKLEFNAPIFLNDRIKTGEDGQAKILLNDDSVLKVSPLSDLHVSELVAGVGEEKTVINLLKGRLRSVVGKKLGPAARYEIQTAVAVAGIRGTDFEVWQYSPDDAAVRCFEGLIEVMSSIPGVEGSEMVGPDTYTRVTRGAPPEPVMPIAPDEPLGDKLGVKVGSTNPWGETTPPEMPPAEVELSFALAEELNLWKTQPLDLREGSLEGRKLFSILVSERDFPVFRPDDTGEVVDTILDEEIYGETFEEQIETFTEPDLGGTSIQMDITIPAP